MYSYICYAERDILDSENSVTAIRYKPENLDVLCKNTMFSRKELQLMYRGFKQVQDYTAYKALLTLAIQATYVCVMTMRVSE